MNNPAIQQTLIELEEGLSKLESARTQVNNVSEKSEQLISSFTKILKSIESITDGIGIDKKSIKENLEKSFKKFEAELIATSKQSDSRVKVVDDTLKSNQIIFQQELDKNIRNIGSEIQKIVSNFQSSSQEQIKLLSSSSYNLINELNKVNGDLLNFKSTLQEVETQLREIDFNKEFRIISKEIALDHKRSLIINSSLLLIIIIILVTKWIK